MEKSLDQQAYDAGYSSVAAYQRAQKATERAQRIEDQRAANIPQGFTERSGSRFNPSRAPLTPVQQTESELVNLIRERKRAGLDISAQCAALGNLKRFTIQETVDFLRKLN
jgi:hypothetical protein